MTKDYWLSFAACLWDPEERLQHTSVQIRSKISCIVMQKLRHTTFRGHHPKTAHNEILDSRMIQFMLVLESNLKIDRRRNPTFLLHPLTPCCTHSPHHHGDIDLVGKLQSVSSIKVLPLYIYLFTTSIYVIWSLYSFRFCFLKSFCVQLLISL